MSDININEETFSKAFNCLNEAIELSNNLGLFTDLNEHALSLINLSELGQLNLKATLDKNSTDLFKKMKATIISLSEMNEETKSKFNDYIKNNSFLKDTREVETKLKNIYEQEGVDKFTAALDSAIKSGEIDSVRVASVFLPQMVRVGGMEIENLASVLSTVRATNSFNDEDIGIVLYELQRTNMTYIADEESAEEYKRQLNELYGEEFEYTEEIYNSDTYSGVYKNNIAIKLKSDYEFKLEDLTTILKPMWDNKTIDENSLKTIIDPLTIFGKEPSNPDIYFNPEYNKYFIGNSVFDNEAVFLSVGNQSYQVNDIDRECIRAIRGYDELFTGDKAFDDILADVYVSDFVVSVHTVEAGTYKNNIDEALGTASVTINRTESERFAYNGYGKSIVYQLGKGVYDFVEGENGLEYRLVIPNGGTTQYEPVENGLNPGSPEYPNTGYRQYMGGKTFSTVKTSVTDAMNGIRNSEYTGYYGTNSDFTFTKNGGSYFWRETNWTAPRGTRYDRPQTSTGAPVGTLIPPERTPMDIYNHIPARPSTPSTPPASSTPPAPSENVEKYIVQPGDTLSDIARRYGVDYNDIAKDNNISNPNYILPGQELIINILPSNDNSIRYVIQPGDTLSDIARRHEVNYNDLAKDNNILNPNYIVAGQIINIKLNDK